MAPMRRRASGGFNGCVTSTMHRDSSHLLIYCQATISVSKRELLGSRLFRSRAAKCLYCHQRRGEGGLVDYQTMAQESSPASTWTSTEAALPVYRHGGEARPWTPTSTT